MTLKIETGTLRDLDVKPGDVVEWVGAPENGAMTVEKAAVLCDGTFAGQVHATLSKYGEGIFGAEKFRIIRRATQSIPHGPVITETVKRIVPGVYGRICIERGDDGDDGVLVKLKLADRCGVPDRGGCHYLNRAELNVAIATLTAIRDAMEDGAK